ncbi:MAG: hypothetical protein HY513_05290 [Candidatus Aenigmarchaeota archaeon]|nr:hypothetical protein [Candidatus Aenigmarchaeota archaeon]
MSMTFKYKKVSRPDDVGDAYNPSIPVTLICGNNSVGVIALLDSGADFSVIPKGIAEILGMDFSGEKEIVIGVGGAVDAVSSRMDGMFSWDSGY